jgi:hypothetical protein
MLLGCSEIFGMIREQSVACKEEGAVWEDREKLI